MKKIFAAILMVAVFCCSAFAEGVWTGAVLAGNLPKDAELVEIISNQDGYIEELLYEGKCTIILARFRDEAARTEYLNGFTPAGEVQVMEDRPEVAGCEALHLRYESGENEDMNVVDCYAFSTEKDIFLFLTSVDGDTYYGYGAVPAEHYPELIDFWAESLTVFKP